MPNKIELIEVGPRDGFQNVKDFIPTEVKLRTIDMLVASGISSIQLTSFVSPKAIAQMSDAAEIAKICVEKYKDIHLLALVPNLKGAEKAVECGIKSISFVISVSESHNRANVNKSVAESFQELKKIIIAYPELSVCLDTATAFGCPFEGDISYAQLKEFVQQGAELGILEFNICDTVGMANPNQVRQYLNQLQNDFPDKVFCVHIHDTRNMGMVNTLAAIECGIHRIQSTVGGLGGCPFAPGASGNTASEDLIYMLNQIGYDTGVDFSKLLDVALYVKDHVEGLFSGHQILVNRTTICR